MNLVAPSFFASAALAVSPFGRADSVEAFCVIDYAGQPGGAPLTYEQFYLDATSKLQFSARRGESLTELREGLTKSAPDLVAWRKFSEQLPPLAQEEQGVTEWQGASTEFYHLSPDGAPRHWRGSPRALPATLRQQIARLDKELRAPGTTARTWIICRPLDKALAHDLRESGLVRVPRAAQLAACPPLLTALSRPCLFVPVHDPAPLHAALGKVLSEASPAVTIEHSNQFFQVRYSAAPPSTPSVLQPIPNPKTP